MYIVLVNMYLRLDFVAVEIVYVLKKGNDSLLSGGFYSIIYLLFLEMFTWYFKEISLFCFIYHVNSEWVLLSLNNVLVLKFMLKSVHPLPSHTSLQMCEKFSSWTKKPTSKISYTRFVTESGHMWNWSIP